MISMVKNLTEEIEYIFFVKLARLNMHYRNKASEKTITLDDKEGQRQYKEFIELQRSGKNIIDSLYNLTKKELEQAYESTEEFVEGYLGDKK